MFIAGLNLLLIGHGHLPLLFYFLQEIFLYLTWSDSISLVRLAGTQPRDPSRTRSMYSIPETSSALHNVSFYSFPNPPRKSKQKFRKKRCEMLKQLLPQESLNPIRSKGGQYCPPDFWWDLQEKLEEPVTWIFLTFPKYVYTLTSKKKNVMLNLTGLLRGVLNRPVKIFCTYFGHIYIFNDVLFRFYHVRYT